MYTFKHFTIEPKKSLKKDILCSNFKDKMERHKVDVSGNP